MFIFFKFLITGGCVVTAMLCSPSQGFSFMEFDRVSIQAGNTHGRMSLAAMLAPAPSKQPNIQLPYKFE